MTSSDWDTLYAMDQATFMERARSRRGLPVGDVGVFGDHPQPTARSRRCAAPDILLAPGLTIVLAVHAPDAAHTGSGIARGDYEMVVSVATVDDKGIRLVTTA